MTLILTINGPETLWMLADRRLSRPGPTPDAQVHVERDDACKLLCLGMKHDQAIIGYTGIGLFGSEEVSQWMRGVLKEHNLPLEQSLGVLADAAKAKVPPFLRGSVKSHNFVATAFRAGEPSYYSIDFEPGPDPEHHWFRYTRHILQTETADFWLTQRLGVAGSGRFHLIRDLRHWMRPLLRLVKQCDRQQVDPTQVADFLANLNYDVSCAIPSVGPRCIVVWRPKDPRRGGGHAAYTGTNQDYYFDPVPTIEMGTDMQDVIDLALGVFSAARSFSG